MYQYREMTWGAFLLASAAAERIPRISTTQALAGDGHCALPLLSALPHAMTAQWETNKKQIENKPAIF